MPIAEDDWRTFLETYQIYQKLKPAAKELDHWLRLGALCTPPLNLPCAKCKQSRTFTVDRDWVACHPKKDAGKYDRVSELVLHIAYRCATCGTQLTFLVEFGPGVNKQVERPTPPDAIRGGPTTTEHFTYTSWVRKVGQSPPWRPTLDKEEERAFGDAAESYTSGMTCEGTSYGVGAFAYYRYVVDVLASRLMQAKATCLDGQARTDLEGKWKAAERNGSDRMALVFDQLPSELTTHGNPLERLYGGFSEGLHEGDDELCMEQAPALRALLLEVALGILRSSDAAAANQKLKSLMHPQERRR